MLHWVPLSSSPSPSVCILIQLVHVTNSMFSFSHGFSLLPSLSAVSGSGSVFVCMYLNVLPSCDTKINLFSHLLLLLCSSQYYKEALRKIISFLSCPTAAHVGHLMIMDWDGAWGCVSAFLGKQYWLLKGWGWGQIKGRHGKKPPCWTFSRRKA